jgi:SsrA-binding protein
MLQGIAPVAGLFGYHKCQGAALRACESYFDCGRTAARPRNFPVWRHLRAVARGGYDSRAVKSAAKKSQYEGVKIVAQNRSASYNYHLLDKLEAGLVLVGTEVKTLREGKGTLREAYAELRGGEAWLINCHIPEYLPGGTRNHDPLRKRKLLLNRREIERLLVQTQQKGMTIVPLKIYFRDGIAKCELAVAKGKKFHDRRESERQKEAKREADEAIYRSRRR